MTKIGFVSLGCSKNLVDTEVMLHALVSAGYEITPDETEADIVVVNTCGFIGDAKQESIDNILDIAWLKKNRSLRGIIATGCMVERYREAVLEEMPEVDAALGIAARDRIVEAVEAVLRGERFSAFGNVDEVGIFNSIGKNITYGERETAIVGHCDSGVTVRIRNSNGLGLWNEYYYFFKY